MDTPGRDRQVSPGVLLVTNVGAGLRSKQVCTRLKPEPMPPASSFRSTVPISELKPGEWMRKSLEFKARGTSGMRLPRRWLSR